MRFRWLLPLLLLTAALAQKQAGILATASDSTAGVTYTFYAGTTPGGENTTPIICTGTNPALPSNQCFFTAGTAGTTYYFYSIAWLNQGGTNIPGPPSTEQSLAFPTTPSAPTLSLGVAVF